MNAKKINASSSPASLFRDVTLQDFADSFGTTVDDLPQDCRELIARTDFRFRILEAEERDQVILDVLKRIDADDQKIGAEERREVNKELGERLDDRDKQQPR